MATPEEQAIGQAEMNQWVVRANEVASRMQEHGYMMEVIVKRTPTTANITINSADIPMTIHIEMFEMLCDKLDRDPEGEEEA